MRPNRAAGPRLPQPRPETAFGMGCATDGHAAAGAEARTRAVAADGGGAGGITGARQRRHVCYCQQKQAAVGGGRQTLARFPLVRARTTLFDSGQWQPESSSSWTSIPPYFAIVYAAQDQWHRECSLKIRVRGEHLCRLTTARLLPTTNRESCWPTTRAWSWKRCAFC